MDTMSKGTPFYRGRNYLTKPDIQYRAERGFVPGYPLAGATMTYPVTLAMSTLSTWGIAITGGSF